MDGGHLGNMLIRIQLDIFSAGNLIFFKVDVLSGLYIVLKYSPSSGAWEHVSADRLKYSQINTFDDLKDDLNPMKSTSHCPVMSRDNKNSFLKQ